MKDLTNCATGTLIVNVYDKDHNIKEHIETHNLVVNMGYYMLADLLAGSFTDSEGHVDRFDFAAFKPIVAMAIGTIKETAAPSSVSTDDATVPSLNPDTTPMDAVSGDQTQLSHEIERVFDDNFVITHAINTNTVSFRGIFLPSKESRGYICEAGLFNAKAPDSNGRDMFSRSIFRPVYKDEADTLEITWLVKIGTLSIDVVNTTTYTDTQVIVTNMTTDGATVVTTDHTDSVGISEVDNH